MSTLFDKYNPIYETLLPLMDGGYTKKVLVNTTGISVFKDIYIDKIDNPLRDPEIDRLLDPNTISIHDMLLSGKNGEKFIKSFRKNEHN